MTDCSLPSNFNWIWDKTGGTSMRCTKSSSAKWIMTHAMPLPKKSRRNHVHIIYLKLLRWIHRWSSICTEYSVCSSMSYKTRAFIFIYEYSGYMLSVYISSYNRSSIFSFIILLNCWKLNITPEHSNSGNMWNVKQFCSLPWVMASVIG